MKSQSQLNKSMNRLNHAANKLAVSVTLNHCLNTQSTKYQEHHTFFDQFRPVTLVANLQLISPILAFAVQFLHHPEKPQT